MKKTLFFFYFILFISINAQRQVEAIKLLEQKTLNQKAGAFIDVNTSNYPESNYTVEDLVKKVLIKGQSSCAGSVFNVKVSPNVSLTDPKRSYGYFNKGTTNFPFDEGIMLMTGFARNAGNSPVGNLNGVLSTNGDVDLSEAIGVNNRNLFDATYIEFDFIPANAQLTFSYLFASAEYVNDYACSYSDGFALLMRKNGDANYTNLAVLPNNKGSVNVTNIHPDYGSCTAINLEYYEQTHSGDREINFYGRTIPLTANATVIPGATYHFKMVVADAGDHLFDTGVFLKAGSFNIGIQINDGSGNALPDTISICEGTSKILNAKVATLGVTYQWYFNGTLLPGEISPTYTASISGTYQVKIMFPGSSCPAEAQIILKIPPDPVISVSAPKTNICSGESIVLTASGAETYTFSGLAGTGNTQTVSPTETTTYTVTGENEGGCKGNTTSITITVIPGLVSPLKDVQICEGSSAVLDAGAGINYTYLWNTGETTQKITVDKEGIYTVTIDNGACSEIFSATVSYVEIPIIENVLYEKNTLTIVIQQPAALNLEYSINDGLNWQNSNIFPNVLPNTNYSIAVRVSGQLCYASSEYYTFFVNNIISPNADGFNDVVDFSGVSKNKEFSALIFDRYGKEVFRSSLANYIWKGDYNGSVNPTGSYWYQVFWIDGVSGKVIQKTGWIVVKNRN